MILSNPIPLKEFVEIVKRYIKVNFVNKKSSRTGTSPADAGFGRLPAAGRE
jgi:hypothetical protein